MTLSPNACETLYLPLGQPNRIFPWELFHGKYRMGAFATQDECFRHALRLAQSMGRRSGTAVRLKIEDERGAWTTVDGYIPSTATRGVPQKRMARQRE